MKHANLISAMSTVAFFLGDDYTVFLQEGRLVAREGDPWRD
jgi:hypothetical protein